ncbi:hypothetical protein D8771_15775 [Streptomyces albus]|uniref:Uncharacterized protein n=1 Tax=Streptomyces albus TaxID=1888 RepID=A0A8H1QS71_9ACTN|nr:hypothetical protein D8771_15775 [Streptomyces albus]
MALRPPTPSPFSARALYVRPRPARPPVPRPCRFAVRAAPCPSGAVPSSAVPSGASPSGPSPSGPSPIGSSPIGSSPIGSSPSGRNASGPVAVAACVSPAAHVASVAAHVVPSGAVTVALRGPGGAASAGGAGRVAVGCGGSRFRGGGRVRQDGVRMPDVVGPQHTPRRAAA